MPNTRWYVDDRGANIVLVMRDKTGRELQRDPTRYGTLQRAREEARSRNQKPGEK